MMYQNKFVASLKVGGKILRENSGVVSLPFGSEYDILLKNLNSRRAMAKVTIDGQEATDGRLILEPNSSLELERFIRDGNLKSGNRFKFIERTSQIEDHRGIKEDDGLVRIEFWAEKEVIDEPVIRRNYYDKWYPRPIYPDWHPCGNGITYVRSAQRRLNTQSMSDAQQQMSYAQAGDLGQYGNTAGGLLRCSNMQSVRIGAMNCTNDVGITVAGSENRQQFKDVFGFPLESNSTVIVLQLRGVAGNAPITSAITVDQKPKCSTCGKNNKSGNKFCSECGTSLIIC